jgi:hypothetical protein
MVRFLRLEDDGQGDVKVLPKRSCLRKGSQQLLDNDFLRI